MSSKNDRSIDLIQELLHTHNVIGYEKTKTAITTARDIGDQFQNERLLEAFIFKECCKIFRITQHQALTSRSNGVRTDCLMVLFVMVKRHMKCSNAKISKNYRKSQTVVTKAIGRFNCLKENEKTSINILSKSKKINDSIMIFKENLYK